MLRKRLFVGLLVCGSALALSVNVAGATSPTFGGFGVFGTFGGAQSQSAFGGAGMSFAGGSAGVNVTPQGMNGFQANATGAFTRGNAAAGGSSRGGAVGGFGFMSRLPSISY